MKLRPMPESQRQTEAEMLAKFKALWPGLLGAFYDAVAGALKNRDLTPVPRQFRMADAAQWIAAAAPALGVEPDIILQAVFAAQSDFSTERANEDALVMRIREFVHSAPYEGYVGELFKKLDCAHDKTLPHSPSHLSAQLDRLRPSMAKAGIAVEFSRKDKRGRKISIAISEPEYARDNALDNMPSF